MTIIELKDRQEFDADSKLYKLYIQFTQLINELKKKDLPDIIVEAINEDIKDLNSLTTSEQVKVAVKQKQTKIIKLLEKQLKIVPVNYYRNIWLAVGMSAFGLPLGVAIGLSLGNIGLLGIGLPIGMAIGAGVGTGMDKKALQEGRQLNVEIKY